MPFETPLDVRRVGLERWRLLAPLQYRGSRESWAVPEGFETDGASAPRLLTWLVPKMGGAYTEAAVLHDWHTSGGGGISRSDADGVFLRVMREQGVPAWKRVPMYAAVRLYSGLIRIPVLGQLFRKLNPSA